MYERDHKTTSLPRRLREELGVPETSKSKQHKRNIPGIRKERRKAERTEKRQIRSHNGPVKSKKRLFVPDSQTPSNIPATQFREPVPATKTRGRGEGALVADGTENLVTESAKKVTKPKQSSTSPPPSHTQHVSRAVKDKLAKDDAEIAALEKALGVKGPGRLPKSFENDGLDLLLDDLDDDLFRNDAPQKRKRDEGQEWLERKRRKYRMENGVEETDGVMGASNEGAEGSNGSFAGFSEEDEADNGNDVDDFSSDKLSGDDTVSQVSDEATSTEIGAQKRARENPYRAPNTSIIPAPKYVPPSLRTRVASETEDLSRLRRQIQGLVNRLSEANLISILADIESLYRSNPRQHVSSILIDLLLGLLCDEAALTDIFIVLHAGFIAAIYKVVGSDFGGQAIQRIDEEFHECYDIGTAKEKGGKRMSNLMSLVSQLYTFQVISSNLVYDYIRMFIRDLSESTAELLLKIVRNAGTQLRHDDPLALKEIVLLVQAAMTRVGEANLSVRTQFMIETINNLKNNRMKTGLVASSILSEHVVRMKKTLGSLNARSSKASEPLRIGLRDIREADKRGKWWLIGASYHDSTENIESTAKATQFNDPGFRKSDDPDSIQDTAGDMLQMARDQRMTTDVRRSIFVAIMSATDYSDAFQRLMKLRLKQSQELEIPKVLVHCAGAEETYNPYYTLLSRRLCTDRKLKMAFQFSLWAFFKRCGEDGDAGADEMEDEEERPEMRAIVNLGKMYGTLIAEGGLTLNALKVLNFAYLKPPSGMFVEVLMITIILHSQKATDKSRDEEKLVGIFAEAGTNAALSKGLLHFLKMTVSKTDIAESKMDLETIKWGCRVARDVLQPLTLQEHAK
ncbi:MAG: hypothetical protein Q9174_002289 [Haloplaca sp. 1 TL-2023]